MSDARRTVVRVTLAGVDVSADINRHLLSLSYTDNEFGEADDLQIKLDDRGDVWLCKWLNASVPVAAPAAASGWAVGDEVIANGRPQYSSYGNGDPGATLTDHRGKITFLNLQPGIPYPIHVDWKGWFAESQVQKADVAEAQDEEQVGLKGAKLSAVIESWDGVLDCGEFEIDSIEAAGPGATVTLKGTSIPYRSPVRQTKKNKAWVGYTLSGIGKEIAAAGGMAFLFESSTDPTIPRAEQVKTSDIAFYQKVCGEHGMALKGMSNTLVVFNQQEYEGKPTVRTFRLGDGHYTSYRLQTGESDTQYDACRVRYADPTTGEVIDYTYCPDPEKQGREDLQVLEIHQKVASLAHATALAPKLLRRKNQFELSAEFSMPGDPRMVAGVTIRLEGWGPYSGKYMMHQARHAVSPSSGYTVSVSLRNILEGY